MKDEKLICCCCGCEIEDGDNYEELDGDVYCESCAEDELGTCEHCGERMRINDAYDINVRSRNGFSNEMWCESCADAYTFCCEYCGEWYERDCAVTIYDTDEIVCYDCADTHYEYCSNCGNYYREECECEGEIIHCYHSASFEKVGECSKRWRNIWRGLGVELEVDGGYDAEECARALRDVYDKLHFEHDGSLSDNGFEIVSDPHTVEEFYRIPWARLFDVCRNYDYRSHDTSTCGLHVHVSREMFGSTKALQDLAISKVVMFYNAFYDDILKLSRRTLDKAEEWAAKYFSDDEEDIKKRVKLRNASRYKAVNVQNRHTIEFRIARGTLNPNTFYAWVDFTLTLVKNSRKIKWRDIGNVELWLRGLKDSTVEYIKSRRAFEGWCR